MIQASRPACSNPIAAGTTFAVIVCRCGARGGRESGYRRDRRPGTSAVQRNHRPLSEGGRRPASGPWRRTPEGPILGAAGSRSAPLVPLGEARLGRIGFRTNGSAAATGRKPDPQPPTERLGCCPRAALGVGVVRENQVRVGCECTVNRWTATEAKNLIPTMRTKDTQPRRWSRPLLLVIALGLWAGCWNRTHRQRATQGRGPALIQSAIPVESVQTSRDRAIDRCRPGESSSLNFSEGATATFKPGPPKWANIHQIPGWRQGPKPRWAQGAHIYVLKNGQVPGNRAASPRPSRADGQSAECLIQATAC